MPEASVWNKRPMHTERGTLPRMEGDLLMRRAHLADAEALAAFFALVFQDPETGTPGLGAAAWTRDLLRGDHPTFHPSDFLLLEDPQQGAIVCALCLIGQTWTYSGLPFAV